MQVRLLIKLVILGGMTLVLAIPFFVIGAVMSERRAYRERALSEVAASTAGEQVVAGPVLVVPFRERIVTHTTDNAGKVTAVERIVSDQAIVLPESLTIDSDVRVESRARGIFHARVLHSTLRVSAAFAPPPRMGLPADRQVVAWETPRLAFGVTDPRGLRNLPTVTVDGAAVTPAPGTGVAGLGPGFSVEPAWSADAPPARARVDASIELLGTQALSFVPVGKNTRASMRSAWPHPSFGGRFLPDERQVSAQGFEARWQLSRLATGLEDASGTLSARPEPAGRGVPVFSSAAFGTSFLDPVDVYRMSERAVKYGMLFVLLTFAAFFLVEVLRRISVHPVQYGLVGVALALFFLLLLSLSEHLPFAVAYALAAAACVGLIGYYVVHVLGSLIRGAGFAAALAVLYAVLYLLLQSEDYALLLGAVLLFGVLALIMVTTRRVDWYRLGESPGHSSDVGAVGGGRAPEAP